MAFTTRTLNAFQMARRLAACEIDARWRDHKAFAAVYPPSTDDGRWLVRRFEIPTSLVAEYFGEEDLIDSQMIWLSSFLAEVESVLIAWAVDSASMDAPWKCDYPL